MSGVMGNYCYFYYSYYHYYCTTLTEDLIEEIVQQLVGGRLVLDHTLAVAGPSTTHPSTAANATVTSAAKGASVTSATNVTR